MAIYVSHDDNFNRRMSAEEMKRRQDAIDSDKLAIEEMGKYYKQNKIRERPDPDNLPLVRKRSTRNTLAGHWEGRLRRRREYVEAVRPGILVARFVQSHEAIKPNGATILKAIAHKHRLRISDLKSACRARHIMPARYEACYEIRRLTLLSLPQIGKILGGRDHSTICRGIREHARRNGLPQL